MCRHLDICNSTLARKKSWKILFEIAVWWKGMICTYLQKNRKYFNCINFRAGHPECDEIEENLMQIKEEKDKHTSAHNLRFIICMAYLQ